eukprot:1096615-Rhodomonas_salina.1
MLKEPRVVSECASVDDHVPLVCGAEIPVPDREAGKPIPAPRARPTPSGRSHSIGSVCLANWLRMGLRTRPNRSIPRRTFTTAPLPLVPGTSS